ncbi:arylsulfatase [Sphingomonas flavalba]|uniref:arylsulfatase n=1 Tax=Sphingomonas flavalba TaxID=2559804 RepID=UPI0039E12066
MRDRPTAARMLRRAVIAALAGTMIVQPAAWAANPATAPAAPRWQHYPLPPVAPQGAPNILLVMTDDVGFGAASTFGGPIPTPNLDRLAQMGLRYTQFHTTAMCSPTRAALLTGRNHHAVNNGAIADLSLDRDGYTSVLPPSAATIGATLKRHGYQTAWIGKNHNTPDWETTAMGPFDRWPNGLGFDYFYGFNRSYANQFSPVLVENRNPVDPPDQPDYILDRDLTDRAIGWLRQQESLGAGRPFLLYYAPGTAHAPIQAPREWIDRFRGKFDKGWDAARKNTYDTQRRMGVIPANARLTPRPPQIPAWSSLSPDQQRFNARLMEAYAGMLAYSDNQFGRLLDELERTNRLENTLVIFIEGDNGAATESLDGAINQLAMFVQADMKDSDIAQTDLIGGKDAMAVVSVGWAWALNTPFQWGKQVASHFGGTRNGMVMAWPRRIPQTGEIRSQFHHVVDIAPTIYEAVGITPDPVVDGVEQQPIDGVSMLYTVTAKDAPSQRRTQYFEILGNRAIYSDGWMAVTTPRRMPWSADYLTAGYDWELYHVAADYSQAVNLAAKEPARLDAMKKLFETVAGPAHVLPVDDSFLPRFGAGLRPGVFDGRDRFTFYPNAHPFPVTAFPSLTTGWTVTAAVDVTGTGASAPVIVRGDRFAGWGLFVDGGRARLVYRLSHLDKDVIALTSEQPLAPGAHTIGVSVERVETRHRLTLTVDGVVAGATDLPRLTFPGTETYIGRQGGIPLLPLAANGDAGGVRIDRVEVSLGGR